MPSSLFLIEALTVVWSESEFSKFSGVFSDTAFITSSVAHASSCMLHITRVAAPIGRSQIRDIPQFTTSLPQAVNVECAREQCMLTFNTLQEYECHIRCPPYLTKLLTWWHRSTLTTTCKCTRDPPLLYLFDTMRKGHPLRRSHSGRVH